MRLKILWLFKNEKENRPRALWRILGMQFILLLSLLILEEYVAAWIAPWLAPEGVRMMDALTSVFAFSVSVWLSAYLFDHRPFEDYGFHITRRWWLQLMGGALLGAGLAALIFWVELALGFVHILQTAYTVQPGASLALVLLVMLVSFTSAAYTEELLVRGYLLRNLMEGLDFSPSVRRLAIALAVLLSSMLFVLPRAGGSGAAASSLNLLVFGIFCAAGALRTGELALPIGLHLAWSFFLGAVFGFPAGGWEQTGGSLLRIEQGGPAWLTGGALGPQAGMIGLAAMLSGIALILFLKFPIEKKR